MNYMFESGFLGTRAPFFMDFMTLVVALLPFLIIVAILFAKCKKIKLHIASQLSLYFLSIIVVGYFEYGIRIGGGFEVFAKGSSLSYSFLFGFLIFHIIISIISVIWWTKTVIGGLKAYNDDELPGVISKIHRRDGLLSMIGISLTSLSGIWVYLFLFAY